MYFGEESKLPLYYRAYPGIISDKAHLRYKTEDNEVISSRKTRFVIDGGFFFSENMQYPVQKGCRFIIALPGHMKFCVELIDKYRAEVVNQAECYLGNGQLYGKVY